MGNVVKLDPQATERPRRSAGGGSSKESKRKASSKRRRRGGRRRPDRTALVLGGGGFTGGMYEVGALRALDLLAVNSNVNDFDVYIGTSAGAFVAALCANGVTPEEMMRVATRQRPTEFRDINAGDLLSLNLGELARRCALLPLHLVSLGRQLATQWGQVSVMDVALELAEGLPSGVYNSTRIERYLGEVLSESGRTNDFRECRRELYITATDLDTCERVVFGREGFDDVPISTAVRASGALPMVYSPVRVGDRELVDGGIVSTANVDIAVQAGAKLIMVINPIVPYINDFSEQVRTLTGYRPRRVSDMGFPRVGYQAFKLLAHRRLHQMTGYWRERYPGVDIVLIEPEATDELMFKTSMMNFTSRIEIAKHGFESVTHHLASEYQRYNEIAERHGIEISAERLRKVIEHFDVEPEPVGGWRRILEGTTGALLRQAGLLA